MSSSTSIYEPGYCDRNAPVKAFLAMSTTTFLAASILVPMRTYLRLFVNHAFWWDDVLLITAYCLMVPVFALLWRMVDLGLGRRAGCYSDAHQTEALKYEYIAEFLEIMSTVCSRTSVAIFVGRLFATTKKMKIILYCYTTFMCLSLIIAGGLIFGICRPVQALWNSSKLETAHCWSTTAIDFINYYNGSVGILSDLLLATLPAYFLSRLQMARHLKIALAGLLGLGLVPGACAMARTILSSRQQDGNPLYGTALLIVFGSTETAMIIICSALSAMGPTLFSKKKWTATGSSGWKLASASSDHSKLSYWGGIRKGLIVTRIGAVLSGSFRSSHGGSRPDSLNSKEATSSRGSA